MLHPEKHHNGESADSQKTAAEAAAAGTLCVCAWELRGEVLGLIFDTSDSQGLNGTDLMGVFGCITAAHVCVWNSNRK